MWDFAVLLAHAEEEFEAHSREFRKTENPLRHKARSDAFICLTFQSENVLVNKLSHT